MYVISEAFDDNTAVVLDLYTYSQQEMTEIELVRFAASGHDVLGLSCSNQQVNYVVSYRCISFVSEEEANDYIKENNLTYRNKKFVNNLFWVLEKKDTKKHVDYYVCCYSGDNVTYVADKGYTPYIQSAKSFDKKTAGQKAALMKSRSKTGKYWTTQRVVR